MRTCRVSSLSKGGDRDADGSTGKEDAIDDEKWQATRQFDRRRHGVQAERTTTAGKSDVNK